jgi:Na+-translocating ferredoxin:NAD+ oxidoreductase RNF subunit RnfB
MKVSRRALLSRFLGIVRHPSAETSPHFEWSSQDNPGAQKAVIQGRFCLAYQNSFCSVCSERCPVPGAIAVQDGIPQVVLDLCTGCGICHDVCPAPTNAIRMIPAAPRV